MKLTIRQDVVKLKEKLSDLVFEHETLLSQVCPNMEKEYVLKFGILEYEIYRYELEIKKLKRKMQLIRVEINRDNSVNLDEINKRLENEFKDYENQLKAQVDEIHYIESTKVKQLSGKDAKKLKDLYRVVIKGYIRI